MYGWYRKTGTYKICTIPGSITFVRAGAARAARAAAAVSCLESYSTWHGATYSIFTVMH